MKNCEGKLFALGEIIEINTYQRGISKYGIKDIYSTRDEKQYDIEISSIDIKNGMVIFVDNNDELVKYFLVDSVSDVLINSSSELYKLIFNNGKQMIITPIV